MCTPAAHVLRVLLMSSIVAVTIAAVYAFTADVPDWFADAVYQSCFVVAMGTAGIWFGSEIVLYFTHDLNHATSWRVWLISIAVGAMMSPWLYVLPAALYGQHVAEETTWHLLSLFAAAYMIIPIVLFGGISAVGIVAIAFARGSRLHKHK